MRTSEIDNVVSMLISVAVWSFYPLLALLVLDTVDAITLALFVYLSSLLVAIPIMAPHTSTLVATLMDRRNSSLWWLLIINGVIWAGIHYSLYTALLTAEKVPAIIIYEVWPIILIVLGPLFLGAGSFKLTPFQWLLTAAAFLGVGLATVDDPTKLTSLRFFEEFTDFGLLFAVLAAVLQAINSALYARTASRLRKLPVFAAAVSAEALGRMAAVPALLLLASFTGVEINPVSVSIGDWAIIAATGVLVFAVGGGFYTRAVAGSRSGTIAVLWYFVPVLSVFLLAAFGFDELTPLAVIGVGLVVFANLFLSTGQMLPNATIGSVVILFLAFYAVYLTSPVDVPSVFDFLAVTGFFFAVLVTFLMDRFRTVMREKEQMQVAVGDASMLLLDLGREQNGGRQREDIKPLLVHLLRLVVHADFARSQWRLNELQLEIQELVRETRVCLEKDAADVSREEWRQLGALEHQVHLWFLTRIFRMSLGEELALIILGVFTIFIGFMGRPDNIYGDVFGVVVATAVAFVSLQLLEFNRGRPIRPTQQMFLLQHALRRLSGAFYFPKDLRKNLATQDLEDGVPVQFADADEPVPVLLEASLTRTVAILVIVVMTVIFMLLLLSKHGLV